MIAAGRIGQRGERIDAELVRQFILSALDHDAAQGAVDELVFDHVVAGRISSSAVAASLRPVIDEILGAATWDDWQAIASRLIADARELEAEAQPPQPRALRWFRGLRRAAGRRARLAPRSERG